MTTFLVTQAVGSAVEAWSSTRLPFEPTDAMREFRGELRRAVAQLSAGPTEGIHARYVSDVSGRFDVENVLLYNVGPSAFRGSATSEVVAERSLGPVPTTPAGAGTAHHYYRYETMPVGTPWEGWSAASLLASFGPVDLGPLAAASRPSRVWFAVRQGFANIFDSDGIPAAFGLDLVLDAPANLPINLATIAKPLIDGVVAAFHAHDDLATLALVAGRVAASLDVPLEEICSLLTEDRVAVLGRRRLLWPWRQGVQWNPADDLCAAFRIRVRRLVETGGPHTLQLAGSLFEIRPTVMP